MGIFPYRLRQRRLGASRRRVFIKQIQELGADHLAQHGGRHGAGQAVVVNVNVEPVHHVVMRVGKELFHGGVAHLGRHVARHKRGKAAVGVQDFDIFQCRQRCHNGQRLCRRNLTLARLLWRRSGILHHPALAQGLLALRPAAQKAVSHWHRPGHRQIFSRWKSMPGCQSGR